jgi:hypothetical protein
VREITSFIGAPLFFTDYRPVFIGASPFKRPAAGLYGDSQCLAIRQKTFPTPPHKKKHPSRDAYFSKRCI